MILDRTVKSEPTNTSRRGFLKLMGGVGAGLTIAVNMPATAAQQQAAHLADDGSFEAGSFVRIHPDGTVSVVVKHLEMGQGAYIGLSSLVAEELDASWQQIRPENAPADAKRFNHTGWGPMQGTGGSSGLSNSYMQMRMAGATARAMLVAAAAQKWQVPVSSIQVSDGVVSHASGNKAHFGELVELAARQPMPAADSLKLKNPSQFKIIGQSVPRNDAGKSNGTAMFTQDVKMDGMLTAMVAHAPRFGGKVKSFDASNALKVKGVRQVVQIPTGVAVLALDYWSAKKGRDQLSIQWDESGAFKQGSDELMTQFKALANSPGLPARKEGDVSAALAAGNVVEAEFEFPFLTHSPMEPMNAVVKVTATGCDVWTGCQIQTLDQGGVAALLGMKPEQVNIHTLFAGGSFGRRANPQSDYVLEAAHIAKQVPGKAVKLVWSREDDTQAGYFRPMYFHKLQATLDADGMPLAWQQRIVGQSIIKGTPFEGYLIKDGIDATSVEGISDLAYSVPNLQVELHTVDIPVPVQWWRSVGHTHTAYTKEVFIDQLARKAGKDPVAYRMVLLKDHPRQQAVLKLAAEKAGWGRTLPEGRALGVAVHESFHSYVAQVAEVSLQPNGGFKVEKVFCAVDCGVAVNPDVIKAQMEGGIGFGLSPALISEITLDQGRVVQSNFHDYQVLRINQMPEIEVHIVKSAEPPTGVGEPGTPPIAPAVANALSALTGQTFNKLPLKLA